MAAVTSLKICGRRLMKSQVSERFATYQISRPQWIRQNSKQFVKQITQKQDCANGHRLQKIYTTSGIWGRGGCCRMSIIQATFFKKKNACMQSCAVIPVLEKKAWHDFILESDLVNILHSFFLFRLWPAFSETAVASFRAACPAKMLAGAVHLQNLTSIFSRHF